jgi:HEAT repeat protein
MIDRLNWDPILRAIVWATIIIILYVITFAALLIVLRLRNSATARRWSRMEDRWTQALLAVLANDAGLHEVWQLVARRDAVLFLRLLVRYAERVDGRERALLADLARPYLGAAVRELHAAEPERRALAIRTLSLLGMQEFGPEVIQALDDESPLVLVAAALALVQLRDPKLVRSLMEKVDRFENWSVAFLAAMLQRGGAPIAEALRDVLHDATAPTKAVVVAAEALRELQDVAAAAIAAERVRTETNVDVLASLLRLIGSLGRRSELPAVRPFATHPHFAVRAQAIYALGQIGRDEDLMRLTHAIEDVSPWVSLHAVRGLSHMGQTALLHSLGESEHARSGFARQVLATG